MQANAVNGGDADGARNDVLHFLNLAVEKIVFLKDLLAVFVQDLTFACESEFLLAPLNEEALELALQRPDLLADGRLGDLVDLRSLGETLGFDQVAKDFQAIDLH